MFFLQGEKLMKYDWELLILHAITFIPTAFSCILGLFNHALNSSVYIASNVKMINELEMMWNKGIVALCYVLFRHLSGGSEEKHKNHCHYSWSMVDI